jgi:hypothetical protein
MGFCVSVNYPVKAYLAVHQCGKPQLHAVWEKTNLTLDRGDGKDQIFRRFFKPGEIVVPVNETLASEGRYALPHLLFLVAADPKKQANLDVVRMASGTVDAAGSGTLTLKASAAKMHGEKVRVEQRADKANIGYWVVAKDWVSWQAQIPRAGRYQVSAEAACLAEGVPFVVELAGKKLAGKAKKTASYDDYTRVQIGVAELTDGGSCEVKMRPKDAKSWKPINVRQLILSPEKQ